MEIVTWSIDRLEELVALWNKELATDFPMRKELFKQNSFEDVNVLYKGSCIALDEEGNVIGFIVAKQWKEELDVGMDPKKGWIQTLLVDSFHQGKGIGSTLLGHAETYLKANGIEQIQMGGDPFHYFPGIPGQYKDVQNWAEKKGYNKRIDTYDLINHMSKEYLFPHDDSVEIALLQEDEKEEFIYFLHKCFPGRWEYEAIKYFELNGDGREFVIIKKNNQIIGFCIINDSCSPFIAQNVYWSPLFETEIGGIGPLGIDKEERKQGYGLAIVQAAVVYLQERGIETIVIDWTGLLDFYGKLDFVMWKKYEIYLKGN